MRASDILGGLKPGSDVALVVLVRSNPMNLHLAAAWASADLPEDQDPDEECPPDTPAHLHLRWLWSRIEPDPVPAWIERAGLPDASHVRRACRVLQDNGIVHPDGEVAAVVQSFFFQMTEPPKRRG